VKFAWVGGGEESLVQGTRVPRPTLGPFNMNDNRSFLVMSIVLLLIVSFAVIRIREGTIGQTLRALRGSDLGAQSIGISPARARITAFAISAFIAGLGGALLAIHQQNVNYPSNFSPFASLFWLVLVVSLGSRTVEGAMQAGAAFGLFDAILLKGAAIGWILRSPERIPGIFPLSATWTYVLFGLGALQFARHPEGLVENGKRRSTEAVERWLARRRGAPVPAGRPAGTGVAP
jgi:ABC-type branched-subunit amino acid transport system permease subunit